MSLPRKLALPLRRPRPRADRGTAGEWPRTEPDAAPAASARAAIAAAETGLACLFRLGVQNGVYADIGAVRRRNSIDGDTLPVSRLVELAGEFGLQRRARAARLGRPADAPVQPPAPADPRQQQRRRPDGGAARRRRGSRDLRSRCSATARCSSWQRADLERAWKGGEALIITPMPPSKGHRQVRLLVVHLETVCRAAVDARRRGRGPDDASDRAVGADLLPAAGRQGGAEPSLLDALHDHRRDRAC